jgi:hypothetical protein
VYYRKRKIGGKEEDPKPKKAANDHQIKEEHKMKELQTVDTDTWPEVRPESVHRRFCVFLFRVSVTAMIHQ